MTNDRTVRPQDHLSKSRVIRGLYSLSDFNQSASAATFLLEECDYDKSYHFTELRRFRCYEATLITSFCRPFAQSQGGTTLSLKAYGISLTDKQEALKKQVMSLRNKVIAHSDEDEMHFNIHFIDLEGDSKTKLPFLQFNESLHLERDAVEHIYHLNLELISAITKTVFQKLRAEPDLLPISKIPESWVTDLKIDDAGR